MKVLWVGCYVDDAFHDLDYGPQERVLGCAVDTGVGLVLL